METQEEQTNGKHRQSIENSDQKKHLQKQNRNYQRIRSYTILRPSSTTHPS
jgi:predicted DNA binding CopG/RHH family protein